MKELVKAVFKDRTALVYFALIVVLIPLSYAVAYGLGQYKWVMFIQLAILMISCYAITGFARRVNEIRAELDKEDRKK